jgi:hypothetical protein
MRHRACYAHGQFALCRTVRASDIWPWRGPKKPLRFVRMRTFITTLLVATGLFAGSAMAGTTGSLSGVAIDSATKAPIAGAKIVVSGPSAVQSTTTDKTGHFTFAALPPDTYTVSLDATGYGHASLSGIDITADNLLTVTLSAASAGSGSS